MRFKLYPFAVLLAAACCTSLAARAQSGNVGIGTTSPHASAKLHIQSTEGGILIPKLTLQQRGGISGPAEGLLVYQTNDTVGFYYYTNGAWTRLLNQATLPANITAQGNTFNVANMLVKLDALGRLPAIDGSQLINVASNNAGALTTGTLSDARLTGNVTLQGNTFNAADKLVKMDAFAKLPAVDGSQLTNLNANSISGTIPVSKGGTGTGTFFTPGSLVYAGASGVYSQNNNALYWSNDSLRLGIGVNKPYSRLSLGKGAANTSASRIAVYEDSSFGGKYFYGLGLSQNTAGTLYGLGMWGGSGGALPGNGADTTTTAPHMFISNGGNIGVGNMNPTAKLDVAGSLKATSFILKPGSGAGKILTATDAEGTTTWTSPSAITGLDASALGSGTVNDARLSTNVTVQGNTFNTANRLVQMNASGALPALNAANLTSLNAAALTGTVDNARLTTTVTLEGNSFNSASKLVKLDASGKLPAVDASQLTNLNLAGLSTIPVNKGGTGTATAFTTGSIVFAGTGGTYSQDNSNIFWQKDSLRLGFGTTNPRSKISLGAPVANSAQSRFAFHEDASNGKYFYGLGLGLYGTTYGLGLWGGTGNYLPGTGTANTMAPHLAILNTGNVGIGTTAPTELLEVNGIIKAKNIKLTDGVQFPALVEGNNGLNIDYYDTTSAVYTFTEFNAGGTFSAQCGNFYRSADFVTQAKGKLVYLWYQNPQSQAPFSIRITRKPDNVVVAYVYNQYTSLNASMGGWTLPAPVDVDSGTTFTLEIFKPDNITSGSCYMWPGSGFTAGITGYKAERYTGFTSKNGKVGIGTATPYSAVSLGSSAENTAASQVAVFENAQGNYFYGMNLSKIGGSYGLGIYGSSGAYVPGDGVTLGTSKPQLFVSGGGNFINAYAPTTFMDKVTFEGGIDIKGTARYWDGSNWRSLSIGSCGGCTQVGYWVTSDRRFKTGIKGLGYSALDRISKINGYRYQYNHDSLKTHGYAADTLSGADQIGFIAQEVETMFPELVKTDSAGYKAVNYAQMTAVLVEAIKELKLENQQLRNDNSGLKAELNERLSALEKKIDMMTGKETLAADKP